KLAKFSILVPFGAVSCRLVPDSWVTVGDQGNIFSFWLKKVENS
ncbi:MAG: hypothetical protein JWO95_2644, partial [Verrucomicrobiales bacterium]|nr:hypothetical protein [Verrucomicrobiales bacterium]